MERFIHSLRKLFMEFYSDTNSTINLIQSNGLRSLSHSQYTVRISISNIAVKKPIELMNCLAAIEPKGK